MLKRLLPLIEHGVFRVGAQRERVNDLIGVANSGVDQFDVSALGCREEARDEEEAAAVGVENPTCGAAGHMERHSAGGADPLLNFGPLFEGPRCRHGITTFLNTLIAAPG